jgi:hypothetical protein
MMMVTVMVMMVGVCPSSDRSEGDGRGQKHRHENFLHHFFLLRDFVPTMALPNITDPAHIADMPSLSSDVKLIGKQKLPLGGFSG